jgi:hypothetical protein
MGTGQTSGRSRTARPDLRFLFQIEDVTARHTSPLLTLRADIAQWVAVNHDGTVRTAADEHRGVPPGGHELRNCSWTSRWDGLAGEWEAFTLTAQAHGRAGWYGWRAEFRQPFSIDLSHAQAMVTVLRRVDTRMARLAGRYGQPAGIAEWAARVYAATGGTLARPFGRRAGASGYELNGGGWQWMDADELRYWLGSELAAFCQAHGLSGEEDR